MRLERGEYEVALAERRYQEVDPANRLVAGTLERRRKDALLHLGELNKETAEYQHQEAHVATPKQKAKVMALVSVQLPPNIADRVRYPSAVVDRIRELARDLPDGVIADQLHREGQVSAKGRPYPVKIIQWIRCRYRIPTAALKRPEELTVQQVAQRFGTSDQVVYYWIEHSVIRSRRISPGMPHWITLSDKDEQALREWVRNSRRILLKVIGGSAL